MNAPPLLIIRRADAAVGGRMQVPEQQQKRMTEMAEGEEETGTRTRNRTRIVENEEEAKSDSRNQEEQEQKNKQNNTETTKTTTQVDAVQARTRVPGPTEPKRESEQFQQRRSLTTADVRRPRRLTDLADLQHRPLNQTFTIASSSSTVATTYGQGQQNRKQTPFFRARNQHRSNSIDSDFAEYGTDALLDLLAQSSSSSIRSKSRERCPARNRGDRKWGGEFSWRPPPGTAKPPPKSFSSASMLQDGVCKLPSLEGFCPGRASCQLQHITRAQFELVKFKRNLNS